MKKTINKWMFTSAGKGKLMLETKHTNDKKDSAIPLATKE